MLGVLPFLLVGFSNGLAAEPQSLSPSALVADRAGGTLYIAERDVSRIAVLDLSAGRLTAGIALTVKPTGLCLAPDGRRLYVTGGGLVGKVLVVDLAAGEVTQEFTVGHSPMAPVVNAEGTRLYVCNRFDSAVGVLDLTTGRTTADIRVVREPVAAALTLDGADLFVLNLLPVSRSDEAYVAAAISVIDCSRNRVATTIALPNGSTQPRGICMSPDGRYAYVTHVLARYQLPTTQLARGWMNTNALTVIEIASRKVVNTVLLDDVDCGAANPWGVACTGDGRWLCVAHAGTSEISVITRDALHRRLDAAAANQPVTGVVRRAEDVPNDLSFLTGIRQRVRLLGKGSRNLVVVGSTAYVAEYFSDTLSIVDFARPTRSGVRSLPLGPNGSMTAARRGEMLFNDANLCFQTWQSCASCHTDEARADSLNWDLLNDGLGNPKNTKSLLLSPQTPPAMSLGVRPSSESAVRAGIRHIQYAVRPEEEATAIDEYVESLQPVPSPYLVAGGLSERAVRGRSLFESAGCVACHSSGLYTNKKAYDVGTSQLLDDGQLFDTPSLIEVWRTAPYLHDGRAETVADVLKTHNPGDLHGHTSGLTDEQIADLAEYVLSL